MINSALEKMAETATSLVNISLSLIPAKALRIFPAPRQDDRVMLHAAAVAHPLDQLDLAYQEVVRQAVGDETNADDVMALESKALERFCFIDVLPPRLLGSHPQLATSAGPVDMAANRLESIEKRLAVARLALQPGRRHDPARAWHALDEAALRLAELLLLHGTADSKAAKALPLLQASWESLQRVQASLPQKQRESLGAECNGLTMALSCARELFECGGAIQGFYNIKTFYLLRLLVRFEIESPQPIDTAQRKECSGALTKLLNNRQDWVPRFLRQCLVRLAGELWQLDPAGNVLFFLKGGRALELAILAETGSTTDPVPPGENDWDAGVVINPTLPAADWYALYAAVHNTVMAALEKCKRDFVQQLAERGLDFKAMDHVLANARRDASSASTVDDPPQQDVSGEIDKDLGIGDVDPPLDTSGPVAKWHGESCKAELIDVGISRRESKEVLEQWHMLSGKVKMLQGLPVPPAEYYIAEYLMLVRSGLAGSASERAKLGKRAKRLFKVLAQWKPALSTAVADRLPKCAQRLAALKGPVSRFAQAALLMQFFHAYALDEDAELARCVDDDWSASLNGNGTVRAAFTDELAAMQCLKDEKNDDCIEMVKVLFQAARFSERMQQQRLALARDYMTPQRADWLSFVHILTNNALFAKGSEIRLALGGALAASLHAEAIGAPDDPNQPPFECVELSIICRNSEAIAVDVLSLVEPVAREALEMAGLADAYQWKRVSGNSLVLQAQQPVEIGAFKYSPVVARITAPSPAEGFPPLVAIDGVALLGLPDLVRQYRRWAAQAHEVDTVLRYGRAQQALSAVLTRFDLPEPQGRVTELLGKDQVHYLQVSGNVVNANCNYPVLFEPDRAYRIRVPDNLTQFRKRVPRRDGKTRELDLLVVNQVAWGPVPRTRKRVDDISENIVGALFDAGIVARHIVLDFPCSAAWIPAFSRLCKDRIYATIYRSDQLMMDTGTWLQFADVLARRSDVELRTALLERLRELSVLRVRPGRHRPTPYCIYNAKTEDVSLDSAFVPNADEPNALRVLHENDRSAVEISLKSLYSLGLDLRTQFLVAP